MHSIRAGNGACSASEERRSRYGLELAVPHDLFLGGFWDEGFYVQHGMI